MYAPVPIKPRIVAPNIPVLKLHKRLFIDAPSLVLTRKNPMIDAKIPILETINGKITKSLVKLSLAVNPRTVVPAATAKAIVAIRDPA